MIKHRKGAKAAKEEPAKEVGRTIRKYRDSCQSDFWQAIFEKEASYLLKRLKGCRSVLSVGCGPAVIEKELQAKGFVITGLDVSKEALEGAPDSVRTVVGSAERMEFESNSFDAVIYVASLQFIGNYEKAIKEAARVLKPEGKLIVMLLNPASGFFKAKTKEADSYVNKIKHSRLAPIEESIRKNFAHVRASYCLGVSGKSVFESRNPDLATIYLVEGTKPQVDVTMVT
ncbi:MAG: class I SAM-dependent methyltransferase [Candidatus Micrarchaeia archaeon]